jgi:hypothetical protein
MHGIVPDLDAHHDIDDDDTGSIAALAVARFVQLSDPALLGPAPACVPLATLDDVRELAYLVRELHWCGSTASATLRLARWLRHPDRARCRRV